MTQYRAPVAKPCSDCPFRRKAIPGWLGRGSPESFIDCMQRNEPLPCHQTIDYEDPNWLAKWTEQDDDTGNMCAGALIFLANKLQRHPFQKLPKDIELVFANSLEFVRHHREAAIRSWDDKDMSTTEYMHRKLIADAAEKLGRPIIEFKQRVEAKRKAKR